MISINSDNSVTRSLLRSSFLGFVVDTVLLIYLISFCVCGGGDTQMSSFVCVHVQAKSQHPVSFLIIDFHLTS